MFSQSISQPLEIWLIQQSAVAVTDFFLALLLGIFIVAVLLKPFGWLQALTHYTPTLLTSLGILGTFVGIVIGLLEFDPTRIDASITLLLNGLKTAFITSLAGMALSIFYKILTSTFLVSLRKSKVPDEDQVGIGDLYAALQAQTDSVQALKKAISENDESSLMGQVKLLRGDLSDQHKATARELVALNTTTGQLAATAATQQQAFGQFTDTLWIKLQDFADMMAKSATEQVIEALKAAIADFNHNLTEQFGDNFKALNEAVGKLLEWQENYKQQIHDMIQQYQLGVSAITQTETSVAKISTDAGTIPETMEQLKQIVEVNQHQLSELGEHLDAFRDIRDRAVEAVPEIRQHIDATLDGVRGASETLARGMNENAEQIKTLIQSGAEGFQTSVDQVNKTLVSNSEALAQGMTESVEQVKTVIVTGAEDFKNSVHGVNSALVSTSDQVSTQSEQVKQHLEDSITDINNILRNLVADLQKEGKQVTDDFRSAGATMIDEANNARKAFDNGLREMRDSFTESLREMADTQANQARQVFSGLSKTIEGTLGDTGEAVKKQVNMIDDAMGMEIGRVMNEMGKALASITGKFTQDYKSLVAEMGRITEAHRRVNVR